MMLQIVLDLSAEDVAFLRNLIWKYLGDAAPTPSMIRDMLKLVLEEQRRREAF